MENFTPKKINPWQDRDRIGGLQAFMRNTVELLIDPVEYFERIEIREYWQEALILCFYSSLFLIWPFFKHLDSLAHVAGMLAVLVFVPAAVTVIALFIKAAASWAGEEADLKRSFFVLAFSTPAFVFALVPVIGYWLAAAAVFIFAAVGLMVAHNVSFSKALIAAVLAPSLALAPYGAVHLVERWSAANPVVDPEREAARTLKALAVLAEEYAKEHGGRYPNVTADIPNNPCGKVQHGYRITCDFRNYGYYLTAEPESWKGRKLLRTFVVKTGIVATEF